MTDSIDADQSANLYHVGKLEIDHLIKLLVCEGYTVIGPKVEQYAITYTEVKSLDELPLGYRDAQRDDRRSRFRQWLTHKLATWQDQFDTLGCVGCVRLPPRQTGHADFPRPVWPKRFVGSA